MPVIALEDFGLFGFNRDLLPHNLPPEMWNDAQNVRFVNGHVEKFLGHSRVYDPPSIAPIFLMAWPTSSNRRWIYASGTEIYRIVGQTHTDSTGAAGPFSADEDDFWQGDIFNGVPILNNVSGADYPQQWDDGLSEFKDLDNWPADTYCKSIKGFKSFLVAVNVTDATGEKPFLVKWSAVAAPGTVPSSWDPNDATKAAGEVSLAQTPGLIIDQLAMGDYNIIYKEDSMWSMQFIGGQQVFRFAKLPIKYGLIAQRCVEELEDGRHVVWTRGDVIVHNGQQAESVIDRKHRKFLFNNVDQNLLHRSYVKHYAAQNEVWLCYVSNDGGGATYPDRALVWNYRANTWGVRELPQVPWMAAGVIDESTESFVIDDIEGIIDVDNADAIIDFEPGTLPSADSLVMCDPANTRLYKVDSTNQFDGVNYTARVARTGLALIGQDRQGQPKADLTALKFLRSVWPKMEANGPVNFYFGGQDSINDPVDWEGPFPFDPNVDKRIDIRINRRLLAYRVESTTNITWKLFGLTLDFRVAGKARRA